MKRRSFIKTTGLAAPVLGALGLKAGKLPLWFPEADQYINFDIAAAGIPIQSVKDEIQYWSEKIRQSAPYEVWNDNQKLIRKARSKTAQLLEVSEDEIALCRNSTEGLDTILRGIDFNEGDEIIFGWYDYPFVQNTILQLEKRYKVNGVPVKYDIARAGDEEIVDAYLSAVTKNTRLMCLTHMLNWNGRILPVKQIIKKAKEKQVEVLLDGAQSFAHLDFSLKDLAPDYFAACYHKWFRGPLGSGFLYIRKNKINALWPLHGENERLSGNIENFQHLSTLDFPGFLSIHKGFENLGNTELLRRLSKRKKLVNLLIDGLKGISSLHLMLPSRDFVGGGIVSFQLDSVDPARISRELKDQFGMLVKVIRYRELSGLRFSMSEEISEKDVINLIHAIKKTLLR